MNQKRKSLRLTMMLSAVVPAMITLVIILCTAYVVIMNTISRTIKNELINMSSIADNTINNSCPGDYSKVGDNYIAIYKGNTLLNGNNSLISSLTDGTDLDITLFYGDLRVITTLKDKDGNSLTGTAASVKLVKDVLESGKPAFYDNVTLEGTRYYSYYKPLFNSDGECAGMLAISKAADKVSAYTQVRLIPFMIVGILGMILVAFISIKNTNSIVSAINRLGNIFKNVAHGRLDVSVDSSILKRNDELSDMGRSVSDMQSALKKMIEIDELTQISNRRSGQNKLNEVIKYSAEYGTHFSVVIGDIDFFKKVNDTYGHEAGDKVLAAVADTLKNGMAGKGFAARWGGEEFLLVFNKGTYEENIAELNLILEAVRKTSVSIDDGAYNLSVTMSFGITEGSTDKETRIILKEADEKLYQAKSNGRNQVVS